MQIVVNQKDDFGTPSEFLAEPRRANFALVRKLVATSRSTKDLVHVLMNPRRRRRRTDHTSIWPITLQTHIRTRLIIIYYAGRVMGTLRKFRQRNLANLSGRTLFVRRSFEFGCAPAMPTPTADFLNGVLCDFHRPFIVVHRTIVQILDSKCSEFNSKSLLLARLAFRL